MIRSRLKINPFDLIARAAKRFWGTFVSYFEAQSTFVKICIKGSSDILRKRNDGWIYSGYMSTKITGTNEYKHFTKTQKYTFIRIWIRSYIDCEYNIWSMNIWSMKLKLKSPETDKRCPFSVSFIIPTTHHQKIKRVKNLSSAPAAVVDSVSSRRWIYCLPADRRLYY